MSKVLVTGPAGFVGSYVVRQLINKGYTVGLLLRESSDLRRIKDLIDKCTVINGDLCDLDRIESDIAAFSPTTVMHLAWGGVKGVNRNDISQMDNVVSSINLFRLVEKLGCDHFVGLGSQAEYGLLSGRISESASKNPTTLYGAAKLATGLLLERASSASNVSFTWLRLFSSYGPGDDPSWLLPYILNCLSEGKSPRLTAGDQIWDYLYIEDVAAGIIASFEDKACGFYNLGSGEPHRLRDIVEKLRDIINPTIDLQFGAVPYRDDQVMHLEADMTALKEATSWYPKVSIGDGLKEISKFHKKGN